MSDPFRLSAKDELLQSLRQTERRTGLSIQEKPISPSFSNFKPTRATLTRPSTPGEKLITGLKRAGGIFGKELTEDIPVLRHLIPDEIKELQPYSVPEKVIAGLTPFARDVGIFIAGGAFLRGVSLLPSVVRTAGILRNVPRVGRFLPLAAREGAQGLILGATTAGSEDLREILKKGAEIGAFTAATGPAIKGVSFLGKKGFEASPSFVKEPVIGLGKKMGVLFKQNAARVLDKLRLSEIKTREAESEVMMRHLEKTLSPLQRNVIQFIRERAFPKEIRKLIRSDPELRKSWPKMKEAAKEIGVYLDEAHDYLLENMGEVGFKGNYLPHIWDIPKKHRAAVSRWFATINPHTKKSSIKTLKLGIEGFTDRKTGAFIKLKPKYNDVVDVLRAYDSFRFKVAANLKYVKYLRALKHASGIKMIQRVDKGPKEWKIVQHPAIDRAFARTIRGKGGKKILSIKSVPVRVHPEIYDSVNAVFEKELDGTLLNSLHMANSFSKQGNFLFSLFHVNALFEASVSAGLGKDAVNALNPVKVFKMFKAGKHKQVLENLPLTKDAIRSGLQIGEIIDVERNFIVNTLKSAEKNLRQLGADKMPIVGTLAGTPFKGVRKVVEYNNRFLWDYLHTNYKLLAFNRLSGQMIKRFPHLPSDKVKEEVATFVNDTFGGQLWSQLGKSSRWQQFAHFLMLSPDWTISTIRQAMSPFGAGANSALTRAVREELGQDFWRRAIVYFGGGMQLLNHTMTKAWQGQGRFTWENAPDKEGHLYIGQRDDGLEQYMRPGKQFREVFEWLNSPAKTLGNKISPVLRQSIIQLSGRTPSGFPTAISGRFPGDEPDTKTGSLVARLSELAKAPAPYSLSKMNNEEFSFISTTIGLAYPLSKGMTDFKARKFFDDALKRGDYGQLAQVYRAALNNGLDANRHLENARQRHLKRLQGG